MPIAIYGVFNVGLGIAYERQISKGKLGLYLPFYYGEQYIPYGTEGPFIENGSRNFFCNPGLKFYVLDKQKISLAVGPSVFTTIGSGMHTQKAGPSWPYRYYKVDLLQIGALFNVHFRFNASPKFFIGSDFGLGPCFTTRYKENDQLVKTEPTSVYPLFNFNIGFRF